MAPRLARLAAGQRTHWPRCVTASRTPRDGLPRPAEAPRAKPRALGGCLRVCPAVGGRPRDSSVSRTVPPPPLFPSANCARWPSQAPPADASSPQALRRGAVRFEISRALLLLSSWSASQWRATTLSPAPRGPTWFPFSDRPLFTTWWLQAGELSPRRGLAGLGGGGGCKERRGCWLEQCAASYHQHSGQWLFASVASPPLVITTS